MDIKEIIAQITDDIAWLEKPKYHLMPERQAELAQVLRERRAARKYWQDLQEKTNA